MGPVTNVVLFDKEPSGVASVRYSNIEAAEDCVKVCSDFQVSSVLSIHGYSAKAACSLCSLIVFLLCSQREVKFMIRQLTRLITH